MPDNPETARIKPGRIAGEVKDGLKTFGRGLLGLLEASRLIYGLAYCVAAVFVMVPISFVGRGLNWALARDSTWIAYPVVGLAVVVLLFWAALMTNEQFLRDLHLKGMEWPSLLSIALAWLAVLVYGASSCALERAGLAEIAPSVPFTDGCASRYADLYLWHLMDSIPGLKFNEIVGWQAPYSYADKLSGWLLLSFKILVIVAVIGSFVVSGRLRREAAVAKESKT